LILNIGIVGLGLIGGSLAKTIKNITNHTVFGQDLMESVIRSAELEGAIDGPLSEEFLGKCDIVITALYPKDTISYIKEHACRFKEGCIVVDCAGVKETVCDAIQDIADEEGFIFIGTHPMAGIEHSGFNHSSNQLFDKASMIMTPYSETPLKTLELVKEFWLSLGFSKITICSPKEHDEMIAFTSQLPHVISSAYIKSDFAPNHRGFSAGSYRDMSRVAKLNETMWTELFFDNKQNLVKELERFIERLQEYKDALESDKQTDMKRLLKDGRVIKELIDG
jgi:prephenate dehydrogenase